jgi:hypothetical protein
MTIDPIMTGLQHVDILWSMGIHNTNNSVVLICWALTDYYVAPNHEPFPYGLVAGLISYFPADRSWKLRLTAAGIRCADHVTPSIRKSWH